MNQSANSAYQDVFEASLDAIICSNETGLITLWNPAAEQMFGYSAAEALGQPLTMLMTVADQKKHNTGFKHFVSTGQPRISGKTVEVNGLGKDGSTLLVELSLSSVKTEQGWNFTTIIRDITSRKLAKEALRESEQKYRLMFDNMINGFAYHKIETDKNGKPTGYTFLEINSAFEKLTGLKREEIIGRKVSEVLPGIEDDPTNWVGIYGKVALKGKDIHFENFSESLNKWYSIHAYSFQKGFFAVIFEDITERKQAEDDLHSLAITFSAVSGEAFFSSVASHFARTLGMDYAIIGELMDGRDRVNVVRGYAHGQAMELPFEYDLADTPCENVIGHSFCIYPSGVQEQFPNDALLVEMGVEGYMGAPLFDSSGHPLGIIALMHSKPIENTDVAETLFKIFSTRVSAEIERKQAEESVRKLSQAIEQAGESIVITDRKGVIEYANPAFTTLTGYSAEEAIGQTPRILKSGNQDAAFYEEMWNTITDGNIWHGKVIDRKKDGSFYPTTLTISPISDPSGDATDYSHFVGIQSDLTELEDLEHQFHQAQKMEAVGTLVGGIAHDFNNMLAGMTGNLYLAKQCTREMPEVIQKLDNIESIAFRASEMIQQLLTFARKGRVSMMPLPFIPFIKETLKLLRPSVPENIKIHQDICNDCFQISGDSTQLHQVLMNLVNNARDALEGMDDPCITIKLEAFHADEIFVENHSYFTTGLYAHLSIADNGCGIPEHQVEHLFEPFFTTKEQGKGTGLGLAMVFGAIKTHHGFIEVESVESEGSTFHIYLPLLESEDIAATSSQKLEVAKGHGEMILLVDDQQQVIETGKEVLESLGYQVITATDGQKAVELFEACAEKIDLVILDVVMPVMGGHKAAQCIRQINPHAKIILSTGYDKDIQTDMENEAVLNKPFSIEEMSHLIRQKLDV